MDSALTGFVRALRAAGAEASTAETLDAARALALVGYADRSRLKDVLSLVLAKSEDEKAIHDEVFELYFSPPPAPVSPSDDGQRNAGQHLDNQRSDSQPGDSQPDSTDSAAAQRLFRTGNAEVDALLDLAAGHSGRPASGAAPTGNPSPLSLALARAASAAGVDDIRFASQTAYYTRRLLDALGISALDERLLARLGDAAAGNNPQAQAEAAALTRARNGLRRQARALVQQRFDLFGRPATETFMADVVVHRAIGRLAPADMDRMKAAVARMAKRLAARHSRRRRRLLRGQLDLRRTLRANAGHDGVPFSLAFKYRRRDKPRIVVVCDVSGSVAAHVRFLLLFLYALHDTVSDLRTFAFSNRLKDVAAPLETLPFDDAMALILKDVGGGSTDYGQAWVDLHDRHWDSINRQTTVLVLGDGRSNHTDPQLALFADLCSAPNAWSGCVLSRPGAGAPATVRCCATSRCAAMSPTVPARPTWNVLSMKHWRPTHDSSPISSHTHHTHTHPPAGH